MINQFGRNYVIIPYKTLIEASEMMIEIGEEKNSFSTMLDAYNQYINAELTPVVLYDLQNNQMICIVKELHGKKLH